MRLRPYQDALANHATPALWRAGKRRVVWCVPVGGGKTACAEALVARVRAADWAAVYYFAHTAELVAQPGERFAAAGIDFGYLWAGAGDDAPVNAAAGVQVCSSATAVNREFPPLPRSCGAPHDRCVAFIDEAHRVRSSTYHRILDRLAASYGRVYVVLMTATPYRRDGRGLADRADALVEAATPRDGFAQGWLVDPACYSRPAPAVAAGSVERRDPDGGGDPVDEPGSAAAAMMAPGLVGDVVQTWLRHSGWAPTIYRCVNRAHARDVARRFREAGVRAEHVDGSMSQAARGALLARLAIGGGASPHPAALDVLTSGGTILEEGFDSAASYRHVLARPGLWSPDRAAAVVDAARGVEDSGRAEVVARALADLRAGADDEPPPYAPLACLGDAAPTTSRGAWIQRIGRACRAFGPADVAAWEARGLRAREKAGAVVLCHSGNLERHGFLVQHEGFALSGDLTGAPGVRAAAYPRFCPPQVVQCPSCFASVPRGSPACPTCGAEGEAVSAPQLPRERRGELERKKWDPSMAPPATPEQREEYLRAKWAVWRAKNEARAAAGQPPLKPGWASVQFKLRFGEWPDWGQNRAIGRLFGARF